MCLQASVMEAALQCSLFPGDCSLYYVVKNEPVQHDRYDGGNEREDSLSLWREAVIKCWTLNMPSLMSILIYSSIFSPFFM